MNAQVSNMMRALVDDCGGVIAAQKAISRYHPISRDHVHKVLVGDRSLGLERYLAVLKVCEKRKIGV